MSDESQKQDEPQAATPDGAGDVRRALGRPARRRPPVSD